MELCVNGDTQVINRGRMHIDKILFLIHYRYATLQMDGPIRVHKFGNPTMS